MIYAQTIATLRDTPAKQCTYTLVNYLKLIYEIPRFLYEIYAFINVFLKIVILFIMCLYFHMERNVFKRIVNV